MAGQIDQAFTKQFEREVHVAYQRMGSLLRNTVRVRNGVVGSTTSFPTIGRGTATTKARHATVTPMNLQHDLIECTLSDYYAPDYIDSLDELKSNADYRKDYVDSGAYALGRKTDELIITALDGATSSAGLTLTNLLTFENGILEWIQALNANRVPNDGNRWGVVSPRFWTWLMKLESFASADYVRELPYSDGNFYEIRRWLGVNWLMHDGLPLSTNTRKNYIYHRTAIGHAIGKDVTAEVNYVPERVSWLFNNMMSQGSVLIDQEGIIERTIDESSALPTS